MDTIFLIIALIILTIIGTYIFSRYSTLQTKTVGNDVLQEKVKILARQAARWSTAAKQDENPLIAVLHANYGAGYLWAINDIITSSQFNEMTGYDYTK